MSATRFVKGISRTISLALAGLTLAVTLTASPATPRAAEAIPVTTPATRGIPVRAPATQAIPPARGALSPLARPSQIALTSYAVRRYRTPQRIGRSLLHRFRWRRWQFRYLDWLWQHESGWNRYAYNPYSGAYGIPQAVPGGAMASAGPGWQWNARTQILWGMRYIRARYGSPYWAWQHELAYNWY